MAYQNPDFIIDEEELLSVGDIVIRLSVCTVLIRETEIQVPPSRFHLLCILARHANQLVNWQQIDNPLREKDGTLRTKNTIEQAIGRLRKDIEASECVTIVSKPRYGYILKVA